MKHRCMSTRISAVVAETIRLRDDRLALTDSLTILVSKSCQLDGRPWGRRYLPLAWQLPSPDLGGGTSSVRQSWPPGFS